ncbi:GntR family transcriptional regulator [Arthrobacter sp. MA-N2]|uniref:GntR family transcriptional regulator n=1 Tax=Arthrobacter sp. MA-N2 TaxID=1101188 RepID=UPI0004B8C60A|nr:FCD domain-containing protein [Arthrobacter sp. MA-N2]
MATINQTKGEIVLRALRMDILSGQLAPGSKLGFAELGRRYETNTGVLREVLPRLVEQGLATAQSQLGYRVITVSVQELEHLTEARVAIETQVLRQSIRCGDLDWESALVSIHHRLTQVPTLDDRGKLNPEWLAVHRRFHEALLDGCPNPQLRAVAQRLRDAAEVYHCWMISGIAHPQDRDVEHERLASLAVSRDIQGAANALTEHIEKTTELLLESQRRRPLADAGIDAG